MLERFKVARILLDRSICVWGLRRFEVLLEVEDPDDLIDKLMLSGVKIVHSYSNERIIG